MNQLTSLSEAQRAAIRALVATHLAAITDLSHIPDKKTPLIDAARGVGFNYTQGRLIADRIIAAFTRRAERNAARIAKDLAKVKDRSERVRQAGKSVLASLKGYFDSPTSAVIYAALSLEGVKGTRRDVQLIADRILREQVIHAYKSTHRYCTNGEISVVLTTKDAACVSQSTCTDWNLYRGQYKGWACNIINTKLVVPQDFRKRVISRSLAWAAPGLVLDARKVRGITGAPEVYHVTYCRQGRGNAVVTAYGFVSVDSNSECQFAETKEALSRLLAAELRRRH